MATNLERLALRHGIRSGAADAVSAAAARLGTTPRMLRYRESLGLLAPARSAGGYRTYGERDLLAAAYAADLEARHGLPPAAVAFALRAIHEPELRDEISRLGRLTRRPPTEAEPVGTARPAGEPRPGRSAALDFETRKARALLRLAS
jgi:MerR family transcriptional regulator, copper efflux regulator